MHSDNTIYSDSQGGRLGSPTDGLSIDGQGPCKPLECDKAMGLIDQARDPSLTAMSLNSLRAQLGDCDPCVRAFDVELRVRTTMTPSMSELPSVDFRARISHTLASVDLSKLDIADF